MGTPLRNARRAGRAVSRYVRQDFREIVWPSSIPNPPGYVEEQMKDEVHLNWKEWTEVMHESIIAYNSTMPWSKKDLLAEETGGAKGEDPSQATLRSELDATVQALAKEGLQGLRPIFTQWYTARASAWRDAVHVFIKGYREGLRDSVPTPTVTPESASPAPDAHPDAPPAPDASESSKPETAQASARTDTVQTARKDT